MAPLRDELRRLFRLAWPAMATQFGTMLMGVVDTVMVGHVSPEALAAAALGNAFLYGISMIGIGVVLGIDPIVSQAHGAGDGARAGLALQRGLVLSALLGIAIGGALLLAEPALRATGQSAGLAREAARFVEVQIPTIGFLFAFSALRAWLQGREIVRPALVAVIAANLLNALLDWVLIFGHLGLPALGVFGAGIATSISRVACFVFLAAIVLGLRLQRGGWTPWSRAALSWQGMREVIGHGMPIGAQLGLESTAFSLATMLAGRLGAEAASAHTIALNLASLSFMTPLGIAQAAVARVGNLVGARRFSEADRAAWVALGFGALVMAVWALVFLVLRDRLPFLYTNDSTVAVLAASILPIAAAFQIFDGLQVVAGGVLRGMGRTRPPAICHAIGLWGVALPLACLSVLRLAGGLEGLWWSLCLGLAVVAVALVAWIRARGPRSLDAALHTVG